MPARVWYLIAAAVLSAGCASAPDKPIGTAANDAPAQHAEESAAAAPSAASPEQTQIAPTRTVDLNRQPPADNTGLVCREMLKPLSNVIIKKCMTPAAWKNYHQAEMRQAQELLRIMQGRR